MICPDLSLVPHLLSHKSYFSKTWAPLRWLRPSLLWRGPQGTHKWSSSSSLSFEWKKVLIHYLCQLPTMGFAVSEHRGQVLLKNDMAKTIKQAFKSTGVLVWLIYLKVANISLSLFERCCPASGDTWCFCRNVSFPFQARINSLC